MKAQFEEKTYEQYFNEELARVTDVYFPPGQVAEGLLGFDNAAFSRNRWLWQFLDVPFLDFPPFRGVDLPLVAGEMQRLLGREIDSLPPIKSNMLFQYKRPEYVNRVNGKEWRHWKQPYYRYSIESRQQNLLELIHATFGADVFIAYASPAIWQTNELVRIHLKEGKLIENSNFKRVDELSSHSRNTFIRAGNYSIACSEPRRIDRWDFLQELQNLGVVEANTNRTNRDLIKNFVSRITAVASENVYFSEALNTLNERYSNLTQYELLYSFLIMKNFRQLTQIQWLLKI